MSPGIFLTIIIIYFSVLLLISYYTGRNADNDSFFVGNRKSPWYVVAFGMIGTSISGVTFISVPGWVGTSQFSYMQMVIGYLFGYFTIANVLMPMYYKLQLTSIYTYLEGRFGFWSYKTGAFFFLLSRTFGASARLFIVANVLQITIFDNWHIPFWATVIIIIFSIWMYTFRGGVKTIIWTDTLLTFFMLLAVGMCIYLVSKEMGFSFSEVFSSVFNSHYSDIFVPSDWRSRNFILKHFLGGAFIAITMTGLDQDMMQKNLSCRSLKDAKKNMYWFSLSLVPINLFFLSLGALLYIYATHMCIPLPSSTDDLFPIIATKGYLALSVGVFFILGIVAATYSSADSALTSLTTSFSVDILGLKGENPEKDIKMRKRAHVLFSFILLMVILAFKVVNNRSVIDAVFVVAGYTYGPLLGIYAFGLFTKFSVKDKYVPLVSILSPCLCYLISEVSIQWFNGYQFGFELLVLNGIITFAGMYILKKRK